MKHKVVREQDVVLLRILWLVRAGTRPEALYIFVHIFSSLGSELPLSMCSIHKSNSKSLESGVRYI